MKTKAIVASAIFGLIALLGVGVGTGGIYLASEYNYVKSLERQIVAKTQDNESRFDNMFKQIQGVAKVATAQKDALKEIFIGYAEGRTPKSDDKALMNWVQESVPVVDTSIYKQVINIITGQRDAFTQRQTELIEVARAYNYKVIDSFPTNFLIGKLFGFQEIKPKIITSTRAKAAIESGEDNEDPVQF